MALLTWNVQCPTRMEALDGRQTALIATVDQLEEAMMSGQAPTTTGRILHNLVDSARWHFKTEETILSMHRFPGLGEHRALHRDLIDKVEYYAARCDRGEIKLNPHLLNFLRDWLNNHFCEVDDQYSSWLRDH